MSVFLHRVGLLRPAPAGYSFTMTAGTTGGGSYQGYDTGLITSIGSIDAEPVPGETLIAIATGSGGFNFVIFDGDIVSTLAGLSVWVDSVEYPFDATDWTYSGPDDFTIGQWSAPAAPVFVDTNMYFVEIK